MNPVQTLKAPLMFLHGGTDHELCHALLNGLKASLMFCMVALTMNSATHG
jgi:hypothetical protein